MAKESELVGKVIYSGGPFGDIVGVKYRTVMEWKTGKNVVVIGFRRVNPREFLCYKPFGTAWSGSGGSILVDKSLVPERRFWVYWDKELDMSSSECPMLT